MRKIKKLTSLVLAGLMVTSQFAVSVYADAPAKKKVVLLEDDFSNFEWKPTDNSNNGVDYWRIESGNNENLNKNPENPYVLVEDLEVNGVKKMDKALHIKQTAGAGFSTSMIRGGRLFKDNTIISAGETVYVEFDAYALDNTLLDVGLVNNTRGMVEDGIGNSIFALRPNNTSVYKGYTQNAYVDTGVSTYKVGDLTFEKNEVQHVKVEYTFNKKSTTGTADTMTVSVTKDGKTKTVTTTTNYRDSSQPSAMYAAKGISIGQCTTGGDIWIDNITAYKYVEENGYTYLSEDFTGKDFAYVTQNTNGRDMQEPYGWRIETSYNNLTKDTGGNQIVEIADFDDETNGDTLYDALKLNASETMAFSDERDKRFRGGIGWDGEIGNLGYGYDRYAITVEMDIVPETTTDIDIQLHTNKNTSGYDHEGTGSLFHIKNGKVYLNDTQDGQWGNLNELSDLTLRCGEINHIKAQYWIHPMSGGANSAIADRVKITLTNGAGEEQTQVRDVDYKTGEDGFTKITGLNLLKIDTTSTVYIDNVVAYREPHNDVEIKVPAVASVDTSAATNGTSDITVTFDRAMCASTLENIVVVQNGKVVSKSGTLSDDGKTYTITSDYEIGVEARVMIPKSVKAADGIPVAAYSEEIFTPVTVENKVMLGANSWTVPSSNSAVAANGAVNVWFAGTADVEGHNMLICVAGYDTENKLVSVKTGTATADQNFKWRKTLTAGAGNSFKVFVWDTTDGKPLGEHL